MNDHHRPLSSSSLFGEQVDEAFAGLSAGDTVRLVHTSGGVPVLAYAQVVRAERGNVYLALTARTSLDAGARVILEPTVGDAARHIVAIIAATERTLTARIISAANRDRREYPRLSGRVDVRYGVCASEADAAAWMRGAEVTGVDHAPSPWMEFSATGLAFEDRDFTRQGQDLLMDLRLPGHRTRWRCVARVIRVLPLPDADATATHRVCVNFEQIPSEATIALAHYTIRVQEALMEG
jgi:hypothetical protein